MKHTSAVKPTQEDKEQYFAAYWGQDIIKVNMPDWGNKTRVVYSITLESDSFKHFQLELISLADITDEDAIEVALINGSPNYVDGQSPFGSKSSHMRVLIIQGKAIVEEMKRFTCVNISVTDFLRSCGYALPWRGYTVEQLISFGWLKLRQKGGDV